MAEKNDGGDKTEKPTPKRLKDARKKGDIPKSREVTSTAGLLAWLVLGALLIGTATERIAALWDRLFTVLAQGWTSPAFGGVAAALGWQAVELTMWLVALLLLSAAAVGLLVEYLQAGPVLAFEKLTPKLEHMNPAEGLKRMFSIDNLVELAKGIGKTALLFGIGTLVALSLLPQVLLLVRSEQVPAQALGNLIWEGTVQVIAWTVGVFTLVSLLDTVWQRHSFTKKLRMSLRDIRQEMKESEGDPYIKHQRKQAHAEWSQSNSASAARGANALIVNPTHVAIAIAYDRERSPVPTVSAKGEDHVARAMREAAEDAGVPIVRNVPLARDLLARAEVGEVVPPDTFDAIAEVVLWAREVREQMAWQAGVQGVHPPQQAGRAMPAGNPSAEPPPRRAPVPGEDLSRYPQEPVPGAGGSVFD